MSGVDFTYMLNDSPWEWIEPATQGMPVYYTKAPKTMNIAGEKIIYMEIEKYSSYDELEPYHKQPPTFISVVRLTKQDKTILEQK